MLLLRATVFLSLSYSLVTSALPSKSENIQWVDCSKHVPHTDAGLNLTGIDLSTLPSTLHCGQLVVPMDYAKPLSSTNNITLGFAMHRPQNPKGVIFYNPGGTDAAAVWAWKVALNQTTSSTANFNGLLDFDLMMADTRGTWSSNELNVSVKTVLPLYNRYPATQKEFDSFHAASAVMIQSFVASSKPAGIIQYVGSKENAWDFESLRVALGYDKIHFLGCSTGTYRVAEYAAMFPQRVGRFVLDAIAPHGMSLFEQAQYDIAAANRGLLRADAYCQNNASCPFHTQGKGSIPKTYLEILAAAKNVSADAAFEVQSVVANILMGQPDFPLFFETMEAAIQGKLSNGGSSLPALSEVVAVPIICNDYPIQDNSFSGWQKAFSAAEKLDTYQLGQGLNLLVRLFCSAWPFPTPKIAPLSLTSPMLWVTADFDYDTPTEKATFAWHQAPNSALLVRHGDDHVTFNEPDLPAVAIMKEFLRTGKLPAASNGTQVTIYAPGTQRAPIPDPYSVATGFVAGDVDSAQE